MAALVETPGAGEWSKRKMVDAVRPHLATLTNPILTSRHAKARTAVLNVVGRRRAGHRVE